MGTDRQVAHVRAVQLLDDSPLRLKQGEQIIGASVVPVSGPPMPVVATYVIVANYEPGGHGAD